MWSYSYFSPAMLACIGLGMQRQRVGFNQECSLARQAGKRERMSGEFENVQKEVRLDLELSAG